MAEDFLTSRRRGNDTQLRRSADGILNAIDKFVTVSAEPGPASDDLKLSVLRKGVAVHTSYRDRKATEHELAQWIASVNSRAIRDADATGGEGAAFLDAELRTALSDEEVNALLSQGRPAMRSAGSNGATPAHMPIISVLDELRTTVTSLQQYGSKILQLGKRLGRRELSAEEFDANLSSELGKVDALLEFGRPTQVQAQIAAAVAKDAARNMVLEQREKRAMAQEMSSTQGSLQAATRIRAQLEATVETQAETIEALNARLHNLQLDFEDLSAKYLIDAAVTAATAQPLVVRFSRATMTYGLENQTTDRGVNTDAGSGLRREGSFSDLFAPVAGGPPITKDNWLAGLFVQHRQRLAQGGPRAQYVKQRLPLVWNQFAVAAMLKASARQYRALRRQLQRREFTLACFRALLRSQRRRADEATACAVAATAAAAAASNEAPRLLLEGTEEKVRLLTSTVMVLASKLGASERELLRVADDRISLAHQLAAARAALAFATAPPATPVDAPSAEPPLQAPPGATTPEAPPAASSSIDAAAQADRARHRQVEEDAALMAMLHMPSRFVEAVAALTQVVRVAHGKCIARAAASSEALQTVLQSGNSAAIEGLFAADGASASLPATAAAFHTDRQTLEELEGLLESALARVAKVGHPGTIDLTEALDGLLQRSDEVHCHTDDTAAAYAAAVAQRRRTQLRAGGRSTAAAGGELAATRRESAPGSPRAATPPAAPDGLGLSVQTSMAGGKRGSPSLSDLASTGALLLSSASLKSPSSPTEHKGHRGETVQEADKGGALEEWGEEEPAAVGGRRIGSPLPPRTADSKNDVEKQTRKESMRAVSARATPTAANARGQGAASPQRQQQDRLRPVSSSSRVFAATTTSAGVPLISKRPNAPPVVALSSTLSRQAPSDDTTDDGDNDTAQGDLATTSSSTLTDSDDLTHQFTANLLATISGAFGANGGGSSALQVALEEALLDVTAAATARGGGGQRTPTAWPLSAPTVNGPGTPPVHGFLPAGLSIGATTVSPVATPLAVSPSSTDSRGLLLQAPARRTPRHPRRFDHLGRRADDGVAPPHGTTVDKAVQCALPAGYQTALTSHRDRRGGQGTGKDDVSVSPHRTAGAGGHQRKKSPTRKPPTSPDPQTTQMLARFEAQAQSLEARIAGAAAEAAAAVAAGLVGAAVAPASSAHFEALAPTTSRAAIQPSRPASAKKPSAVAAAPNAATMPVVVATAPPPRRPTSARVAPMRPPNATPSPLELRASVLTPRGVEKTTPCATSHQAGPAIGRGQPFRVPVPPAAVFADP